MGVFGIEPGDVSDRDLLRADRFTGARGRATAETFLVHLGHNVHDAGPALGTALREKSQVRYLGGKEQQRRTVLAGGDAGPAPDTGSGREGGVGLVLLDRDGISVNRVAGIDGNIPSRLDDPVKRAP